MVYVNNQNECEPSPIIKDNLSSKITTIPKGLLHDKINDKKVKLNL